MSFFCCWNEIMVKAGRKWTDCHRDNMITTIWTGCRRLQEIQQTLVAGYLGFNLHVSCFSDELTVELTERSDLCFCNILKDISDIKYEASVMHLMTLQGTSACQIAFWGFYRKEQNIAIDCWPLFTGTTNWWLHLW